MELAEKKEMIRELQEQILSMQGCHSVKDVTFPITGLAHLERAFPRNIFPLGAVHEFLSYSQDEKAATNGFIGALLSRLNRSQGLCLWVGAHTNVYPPALEFFDINPDQIVFIHLDSSRYALWALEESLKCSGVPLVVAEISDLSFKESRRLQLAVEKSGVTGFVHRFQPWQENTVACVSRWRIKPMASQIDAGTPGLGNFCWDVELLKVRNGRPGKWQLEWTQNGLQQISPRPVFSQLLEKKTG